MTRRTVKWLALLAWTLGWYALGQYDTRWKIAEAERQRDEFHQRYTAAMLRLGEAERRNEEMLDVFGNGEPKE